MSRLRETLPVLARADWDREIRILKTNFVSTLDIFQRAAQSGQPVGVFRREISYGIDGGFLLMGAEGFFEHFCVSQSTDFETDPLEEAPNDVVALWAQGLNNSYQAGDHDEKSPHHDYAEAAAVWLMATAILLTTPGVSRWKLMKFEEILGISPQEYIAKNSTQ